MLETGQSTRDVVDKTCARLNGVACRGRVERVDADGNSRLRQCTDDRHHATRFDVDGNALGPRPRGLSPDVDDVGPRLDEFDGVRERGIHLDKFAPVTKRIGRHVQDAHHNRALHPQQWLTHGSPPRTRS